MQLLLPRAYGISPGHRSRVCGKVGPGGRCDAATTGVRYSARTVEFLGGVTNLSDKILIVSDYYYPDDISTGYFLTGIAEGLAGHYPVQVFCGWPAEPKLASAAPRRELRKGVSIRRHRSLGGKDKGLMSRILRNLHFGMSTFLSTLLSLRRGDIALVVTNPPLLPFFVAMACWLRNSRCLLLVHDVYPEVLVATGILGHGSPFVALLGWMNGRLYRNMDRIIVLGRDMKRTVGRRLLGTEDRVVIVPNWGDIGTVRPAPRAANPLLRKVGIADKFIVLLSGNLGRGHDIESVVACAQALCDDENIHFLVAGGGSKRAWLARIVKEAGLTNLTLLERQDRHSLSTLLNAADLTVIAFLRGMVGVSVPSRLYNLMAAGKPVLAAADADSELALVVREERIGWVVPPEQPNLMIEAILAARADRARLREFGVRARQAAVAKYSEPAVIDLYLSLIESLRDDRS